MNAYGTHFLFSTGISQMDLPPAITGFVPVNVVRFPDAVNAVVSKAKAY